MSTEVIVYVLTALAAVVVVLTRLRLGRGERRRRPAPDGPGLRQRRTPWPGARARHCGSRSSSSAARSLGIVALACWWIVVVAGLLILVRWLPSRGKHASDGQEDTWSDGPGLSILAHVGMLVGVGVFTWAYLTAAV